MEIAETTPQVFKNTISKYGNRVALRKKEYGLWHDISWKEYCRSARYVGAALISMGLKKGDSVAILGNNCPEWVFIDMGVQCVGGVSAGVYSTSAWSGVEYIVKNSESKYLFVEDEEQLDKWFMFRGNVPRLKKIIVWETKGIKGFKDPMVMTFDELLEMGRRRAEEAPDLFEKRMAEVSPGDIAVLIYTSGTTGLPKGAMLTHRNVTWLTRALQETNPLYDTDEVLSFLPPCHIFERLFSVFGHIAIGYTVNFVEGPDTVTENMREVSPTLGYGVPRIWEKYYSAVHIKMAAASWFKRLMFNFALKIGLKRASLKTHQKEVPFYLKALYQLAYFVVFWKLKQRLGFERLRIAYSGAAPISEEVLLFFQAIGVDIVEGYGETEDTGVSNVCRIGRAKIGTVGPPLEGAQVKIAEDGEILVKSPAVFKGYYKNPKATQKVLIDGWLHTGDIGEMDEEGNLKIVGRKKDIIITAGGKNISPQYIENKLKSSPYINDAVVIGDRRKYLTCLILIDEDNVVKYAQDHKVQFSTYRDLTQAPETRKLIEEEVEKANENLSQVEQIRKFAILPKKLYVEDGEVTPTLKVKRAFVNEAFKDIIDEMYQE